MKLCWETLDNIGLYTDEKSEKFVFKFIYNDKKHKKSYRIEFMDYCKQCGSTFVSHYNSKALFCDRECKDNFYRKSTKEINENSKQRMIAYSKRRREEAMLIGKNCRYKTYGPQLEWCEEVRRDPERPVVLQVKCYVCNEWFTPLLTKVSDRLISLKDNGGYALFVCGNKCASKCPKIYMNVKQAENYDYLHYSEKTKYSKKNNIPYNVVHYNWQKHFWKQMHKEQTKFRIHRNGLKRMLEKETRNKERKHAKLKKQAHLKSDEFKKREAKRNQKRINTLKKNDPRHFKLKRLLYYSKVRAKQKNIDNDITYEWLDENTGKKCPKCNIDFRYDFNIPRDPFAPSIDRIDNKKGYTSNNCIVTSWIYNCGKGSYNEKYLYEICKTIVK